jgi:replication factor C subunit 1
MEQLDFTGMLERETLAEKIRTTLTNFQKNKHNLLEKRGIYVYGSPGAGKTRFVNQILKDCGYDVIAYDAGDIRNKAIIETITSHTMAEKSIVSLFEKKARPIAIVMDEIDGMNNGDKGGINELIKLIRPKKTKKQKQEKVTYCPIICISNYHVDKKIKELQKVCETFEVKTPTNSQVLSLMRACMPELGVTLTRNIVDFLQGDLRKLDSIYRIYTNQCSILKNEVIQDIFRPKSYNEDTKEITKKLINDRYSLDEHLTLMNETDRTIVGLLFHENVIDVLEKRQKSQSVPLYLRLLDNICFADYMDRITFQKQIWQFNEMTSLIKTFHNNKIFHETLGKPPKYDPTEVRFTKVLTKYSTEYNNSLFIQNLCQQLGLDKKDTFAFFMELRGSLSEEEISNLLETYDISKLDISRIYRYLDKYILGKGETEEAN